MRLKVFRDPSLQGAMAQLRAVMGPEALILSTRRVSGGVEVTAALDQPEPPPKPRPKFKPREDPPCEGGETARLAQLDWHGVPLALARRLRAGPLAFALSLALRFSTLDLTGGGPVLLAGPPGAGKTLTLVRLATRLVLAGARPFVISADAGRAGAAEQLAAFTRLLGIELVEAASPSEAAASLGGGNGGGPVLIDTEGGDPWGGQTWGGDAIAALAAATGARIVAVLPAGLDPAEAADLAAIYADLGAVGLVATRLDIARRLGGVLAAVAAGLPMMEAGIGPGAADGLAPATPDLLARRLLAPVAALKRRE